VVNDSADVTSSRRSFHVCGSVTGIRSAANSRQSAGRHYQAIGAERTQRLDMVGDTCERAEVPRRKSVDDYVNAAILTLVYTTNLHASTYTVQADRKITSEILHNRSITNNIIVIIVHKHHIVDYEIRIFSRSYLFFCVRPQMQC